MVPPIFPLFRRVRINYKLWVEKITSSDNLGHTDTDHRVIQVIRIQATLKNKGTLVWLHDNIYLLVVWITMFVEFHN